MTTAPMEREPSRAFWNFEREELPRTGVSPFFVVCRYQVLTDQNFPDYPHREFSDLRNRLDTLKRTL